MSTDVLSSSTEQFPTAVAAPAASDARTSASVRTPMGKIADGLRWLRMRLEEATGKFAPIGGLFPVAIESTDTSGDTITITGHGLSNGDIVALKPIGAGTVPTGLSASLRYYVVGAASNTIQLSHTRGGAAINLTGAASGSVYVRKLDPSAMQPILYAGQASTTPGGSTTYLASSNQTNGQPLTTSLSEPSANAIVSLSVASGFTPGARWRLYTTAALVTYKIELRSEGGSTQATFPIGGSRSWAEFEASTVSGDGWALVGWGGSTTTP